MSKLNVPVEERVTDPENWHPHHRRRVREWAEARVFWRRGAPSYPTRAARSVRPTPRGAVRAMRTVAGKAAA
jgi:hypothetical protein